MLRNYDYFWLKTMLDRECTTTVPGSTLITGASYALNGIYEKAWKNAVNCSMHSQDLYYDFQCVRRVISSTKSHYFERCFIITGYSAAFHDLSLCKKQRLIYVSKIHYPIFHDAHNWDHPVQVDPWAAFENVPKELRATCEDAVVNQILQSGTYYADFYPRRCWANIKGGIWSQATEQERQAVGTERAERHNRLLRHKTSLEENKRIFQRFVRFLYDNDVIPIMVIPPFTQEYKQCILKELEENMLELLDSVPEYVHYVDFNETPDLFGPEDFMDSDHLSAVGAEKMSAVLAELFGQ